MPYGDKVSVVCKFFDSDRIDISACFILCKVELDQVGRFKRLSICGISVVVDKPSQYVFVVEYLSFGCAYWRLKGLQAQSAEVIW